MDLDDRPWEGLPAAIAVELRNRAGAIVDDVVATVQAAIPAYSSGGAQGDAAAEALGRVRVGVEQGLLHFANLIEDRSATVADQAAIYRQIGRATHDTGMGLDVMNSVFRIVARTAWRWMDRIQATAEPPGTPLRLAEAVIVYVDALSVFSAEGYAEAIAAAAGERHESRFRLLEMLLQSSRGVGAVRDAAHRAGWRVPATVSVVALGPGERANEIAGRIDPDVLAGSRGESACLLIPSPSAPGRRALVERALSGRVAAIGPEVPTGFANRSLAWAKRLLDLEPHPDRCQPGPPARADEHFVELLLLQDQELLNMFVERRLSPLRVLPAGARTRMSETLLAWLKHNGSAPKASAELNVHPQTIRYRLAQIHEMFPAELDNPDMRFELELALRAERFSTNDGSERQTERTAERDSTGQLRTNPSNSDTRVDHVLGQPQPARKHPK